MRALACAIVATFGLAAHPAFAEDRAAAAFWKSVQAKCDVSAAKPPGELGRRIAKTAIDEFRSFGGHEVDNNGRLFRFGLTEAEHEQDDGGGRPAEVGRLGWWQVMKYWRSLYGEAAPEKLEVQGYRDASILLKETDATEILRGTASDILRAADGVSDPQSREILREGALRGAVIDTPWSAAFISYVIRHAGVAPTAFQFSNAHRAYIYDAFTASAAEMTNEAGERIYRACPVATRPRPGDLICFQREPSMAGESDDSVRERIRTELAGNSATRSVRRAHCDVVAHVDAPARKVYSIGGNILQSITARKMNLHSRGLKFSAEQKGRCGGPGQWTLPQSGGGAAAGVASEKCSLNDKKWFVLLQLR